MGARDQFASWILRGAWAVWLCTLAGMPLKANPIPHEFHVTVTNVDHNPRTQALEITFKLFTDDIEKTVKTLGGSELRLGSPQEAGNANILLKEYLQNRFQLRIDGHPATLEWVGKEVELDAVWCYLEVRQVPQVKEIEVTNRILTELFADQTNIVHLNANGETKSLFLSKEKVAEVVSW